VGEPRISQVQLGPAGIRGHEVLTIGWADPSAGALRLHLLDRGPDVLSVVDWLPGTGMLVGEVRLPQPPPGGELVASVSGRTLCLASDEGVFLIDDVSGVGRRVAGVNGPAIISPDGRRIIVVTDRGLLTVGMWTDTEGQPPFAAGIAPLVVADFDSPNDIRLVAGNGADGIGMVVGCYGNVVSTDISRIAANGADVRVRSIPTAPLPYDPIEFAFPGPLAARSGQEFVYALDQGRTGVMAIEPRSGRAFVCPLEPPVAYGRLWRVVPNLDSSAALVELKGGATLLWRPGGEPRPIDLPDGVPLVWHEGHALVWTEGSAGLRQVPFSL